MYHAESCKDHLIGLINGANNAQEIIVVAETMTIILTNTKGLWLEARYCYKASELAQRVVTELASYEVDGVHYKTEENLRKHRLILAKLADEYHVLQCQQREDEKNNPVVEHCCAG